MKFFLNFLLICFLFNNNSKIWGSEEILLENYSVSVTNENFKLFNIEMKIKGSVFQNLKLKIAIDKKKSEKSWFKILISYFSKN